MPSYGMRQGLTSSLQLQQKHPRVRSWAVQLLPTGSSSLSPNPCGADCAVTQYSGDCQTTYSCQNMIVDIDSATTPISIYGLSTVGVTNLLQVNGVAFAAATDNLDGFAVCALLSLLHCIALRLRYRPHLLLGRSKSETPPCRKPVTITTIRFLIDVFAYLYLYEEVQTEWYRYTV
jgi:hypothetical protein